MDFNLWIYVLASLIGVFIGYIIHMLIADKPTKPEFYQQDGNIYVEPKPTRADRYSENEWRDGIDRKI